MSLEELPVIASCDGCGACCTEMNSPPFMPARVDGSDLLGISATARGSFEAGMARREEDGWPDGVPCFWLDPETRRCRHYDDRPDICRFALELGDESCRAWREQLNIQSGSSLPKRKKPK